jgi:SAM-dependent methyltransferase
MDLRAVKCKNCGLIFIHPQPDPEELKSLYNEDYFRTTDLHLRPHGRADYIHSVEEKKEKEVYNKRLQELSKYVTKGNLLEIGCGPGHFLHQAKLDGWEVIGIEISQFAAQYAKNKFGLNVFEGTVDEVALPEQTFDVVFMGDLLEHIPNPKELLLKIKKYISDNGIVYVEVPSVTNGLFSRLGTLMLNAFGKIKYINLPPYHLFEFTPRNCRALFDITNYTIIRMRQGIVSPKDIGFRDSLLTNLLKFKLQLINYLITKSTGRLGDRLTIIARPKLQNVHPDV